MIGEIVQNGISLTLNPMLNEAEKDKAEAEKRLNDPTASDEVKATALQQWKNADQVIRDYGYGSDLQLAIRAVTGALQGLVTKDKGAAIVGAL